jgi:diguanylate cyclase (GGDEF)-like protein
MGLDYAKWSESVEALSAGDIEWLYNNIASSAVLGEAFQLIVFWGGPLDRDIGWIDNGREEPQTGLLAPSDLQSAAAALRAIPVNSYEGLSYFLRRGEEVYAVSVTRVEAVVDAPKGLNLWSPDDVAIQLMAFRIDQETLDGIGEAFQVGQVRLAANSPASGPSHSIPLPGLHGLPVAYVLWDDPNLDAQMIRAMLPATLVGLVAVLGLSLLGLHFVQRDANSLVLAQHQAHQAARTDAMTGLPNRPAFNQVLSTPAKPGERAILFLDVNGFKRINDSIGHAAGDAAIVAVSQRLSTLVHPGTFLARIAGDEFVFLVLGPEAQRRTVSLAESVDDTLVEPFDILGHRLVIRLAKGYAVQTEPDMAGEDLVRQADLAMYEAKRRPDLALVAFSSVIAEAAEDASLIEQRLRQALGRQGEIFVAYQPIVNHSGRLSRVEALARWTSPELGPISPGRFIPVAEQAGLIIDLGRHLLHLICADLQAHPGLRVAVNISPLQILSPGFVSDLVLELRERGIEPSRMEIELTESVMVDDSRLAAERLAELRAAGFTTALDDFGTGYSSIGSLRRMDFNALKIDRSFVAEVVSSKRAVRLMRSMIDLAHGLDLKVVCEGVETEEELRLVRELGCDLVQGYHLGRPMTIAALAAEWLTPPPEETTAA